MSFALTKGWLSTQLIILNYPVILSYQCSTIVSLETYPLYLWLINWHRLIDCDWPHIGWLTEWLSIWLIKADWLDDCLRGTDWLIDWLIGLLPNWKDRLAELPVGNFKEMNLQISFFTLCRSYYGFIFWLQFYPLQPFIGFPHFGQVNTKYANLCL